MNLSPGEWLDMHTPSPGVEKHRREDHEQNAEPEPRCKAIECSYLQDTTVTQREWVVSFACFGAKQIISQVREGHFGLIVFSSSSEGHPPGQGAHIYNVSPVWIKERSFPCGPSPNKVNSSSSVRPLASPVIPEFSFVIRGMALLHRHIIGFTGRDPGV